MIVRAADQNFFPRLAMGRFEIMPLNQFFDFVGRERREQFLRQFTQQRVAQTVDSLEMLEKQNEPFEVRCLKLPVNTIKWMRNGVRNFSALQIALKRKYVVSQDRDVLMLFLGDTPDQKVDLAGILREIGRDLLAD